jgi:catalase
MTHKTAILVGEGFHHQTVKKLVEALAAEGAEGELVGPHIGELTCSEGKTHLLGKSFSNCGSPLYDSIVLVGSGEGYEQIAAHPKAGQHVWDAFLHKKPIGAAAGAEPVLRKLFPSGDAEAAGLVLAVDGGDFSARFIAACQQLRFWSRPEPQLL